MSALGGWHVVGKGAGDDGDEAIRRGLEVNDGFDGDSYRAQRGRLYE